MVLKTHVLIPGFKEITRELQAETGVQFPYEITIGGKTVLEYIIESPIYKNLNIDFVLIINPKPTKAIKFTKQENRLRIIELKKSNSIGDTITQTIKKLSLSGPLIINMADTIIDSQEIIRLDTVYTSRRFDAFRWTNIQIRDDGFISIEADRSPSFQTIKGSKCCVGLFAFSDGNLLLNSLEKSLNEDEPTLNDPFFDAISHYSKVKKLEPLHTEEWTDVGNIQNYFKAKTRRYGTRAYNNIHVDLETQSVTKTSSNSQHLKDQMNWYKTFPNEFQIHLPKLYSLDDGSQPKYVIELISNDTLAESFINDKYSVETWQYIANSIRNFIIRLDKYRYNCAIGGEIFRYMYITKTQERIQDFFHKNREAGKYYVAHLTQKLTLAEAVDRLPKLIKATGLLTKRDLYPIHGDLCFSNVTYDPRMNNFKIIDPRGSFGMPGIYGDRLYDIGKILHSSMGYYDLIIANKYNLEIRSDNELRLSIKTTSLQSEISEIFKLNLQEFGERVQILAILSTIFLSMVPIHHDSLERQLAFVSVGLRFFIEAERTL
jgi:hypothetical protein